ncbi:MAG: sigma-70 family RNA polymerase sigma factor [Myxococcaceae bacterium]|nr:sigma-70 family RNA polymerase sigma factor [Myxococcaceae bacterium]
MARDENPFRSLTQLLRDARDGDPLASNLAFSLIYKQLHAAARRQLQRAASNGVTLTPTALVNEAWLKLSAARFEIKDREHYLAIAATAMRQIVVDAARARLSGKRGGGAVHLAIADEVGSDAHEVGVLQIDAALQRLEKLEPRLAQVVQYRYFAGLTEEEIARLLGITDRTVRRDWRKARAFLYAEIRGAA